MYLKACEFPKLVVQAYDNVRHCTVKNKMHTTASCSGIQCPDFRLDLRIPRIIPCVFLARMNRIGCHNFESLFWVFSLERSDFSMFRTFFF